MKVFVSGKTEDMPAHKLKRFHKIKLYLENHGHIVITELDIAFPELGEEVEKILDNCDKDSELMSWLVFCMKKNWAMANCDALLLLKDWQECETSVILWIIAKKLNMPIYIDDRSDFRLHNEAEIKNWFENQID